MDNGLFKTHLWMNRDAFCKDREIKIDADEEIFLIIVIAFKKIPFFLI